MPPDAWACCAYGTKYWDATAWSAAMSWGV